MSNNHIRLQRIGYHMNAHMIENYNGTTIGMRNATYLLLLLLDQLNLVPEPPMPRENGIYRHVKKVTK